MLITLIRLIFVVNTCENGNETPNDIAVWTGCGYSIRHGWQKRWQIFERQQCCAWCCWCGAWELDRGKTKFSWRFFLQKTVISILFGADLLSKRRLGQLWQRIETDASERSSDCQIQCWSRQFLHTDYDRSRCAVARESNPPWIPSLGRREYSGRQSHWRWNSVRIHRFGTTRRHWTPSLRLFGLQADWKIDFRWEADFQQVNNYIRQFEFV